MKKIFIFISFILLINLVSASLGTFKQNECVDIKTILNTTSVNISTISNPSSTVIISNQEMTKLASTFNYTFCNTTDIGIYIYDYFDAEGNVYVNDFEISPSGFAGLSHYYWLIIILIIGILALGFWIKDGWIVILGSMGLLFLGFWIIIYGIDFVKNTNYTYPIGLLIWGIALYLIIKSSIEMLE